MLDTLYESLKPDFMDAGMMLGVFYCGAHREGAYGKTFPSMDAPFPLFAVRYMVREDKQLIDASDSRQTKAYQTFFPNRIA